MYADRYFTLRRAPSFILISQEAQRPEVRPDPVDYYGDTISHSCSHSCLHFSIDHYLEIHGKHDAALPLHFSMGLHFI